MWADILGHKQNKEFLEEVLKGEQSNSALLFYGPKGVGKYTLAKSFAQSLLCAQKQGQNDQCISCKAFKNKSHPDYIEVKQVLSDKDLEKKRRDVTGKQITLEQIKEMMKQTAYAPTMSTCKVCVIDAADFMTLDAQNSLLKLLEEPPEFWNFILVATDINALLPTILSRVIKVRFDNLATSDVEKILAKENLAEADVLACLAEGSPGRALYINALGALEARENVLEILDKIPSKIIVNEINSLSWLEKISKQNAQLMLEMLSLILRDGLFLKEGLGKRIINKDVSFRLEKSFLGWTRKQLKDAFNLVQETYKAVGQDVGGKSAIETLLIKVNDLWEGR